MWVTQPVPPAIFASISGQTRCSSVSTLPPNNLPLPLLDPAVASGFHTIGMVPGSVASRSELGPDLYAACVAGRSVAA
jgi:hypothetical protein